MSLDKFFKDDRFYVIGYTSRFNVELKNSDYYADVYDTGEISYRSNLKLEKYDIDKINILQEFCNELSKELMKPKIKSVININGYNTDDTMRLIYDNHDEEFITICATLDELNVYRMFWSCEYDSVVMYNSYGVLYSYLPNIIKPVWFRYEEVVGDVLL